ncbi:MAG: sodium:proton antiporter, partial [Pseudomonadota bacterium]
MATSATEPVAGAALSDPVMLFALIGVLGIGSQWLAWRLRMPAIVLMLVAGLLAGPVTGLIDPEASLEDLFRPIISIAVAVILFEGGITLDFRSLRDAGPAVRRLVFVGAPLGWLLSALAIRYGAGLSWESAAVFGGILVVTGPTVVQPLLRQARMAPRPASVLRWEAIVNDPVGALAAVLAFEVITAIYGTSTLELAAQHLAVGVFVASLVGYAAGYALAQAFRRAWVPEYMKVPVLFGSVLAVYASTDSVLHESGLLAVTIMGIYIANAHLPSLEELKRFKEHVTVILVSGVFILLAASLKVEMVALLDWRAIVFVALIILFARPVTVWLSLIGTNLSWQEKAMVAWIGPRGVVAVAVAGLFGTRLADLGVPDGAVLAPLAFALVAAT